ncbi:MAG: hypothetical protein ABDH21_02515 [bacterium]
MRYVILTRDFVITELDREFLQKLLQESFSTVNSIKADVIKKVDCQNHSLKQLEEILCQQTLFHKNLVFVLDNFISLVEKNNSKKVIDMLDRTKSCNLIITIPTLNSIKDPKVAEYIQKNFKIIDKIQYLSEDKIDHLVSCLIKKYNFDSNSEIFETIIPQLVRIVLSKTQSEILTEKIIDQIISDYESRIDKIQHELDQEAISFYISQYSEINMFNVVNLFLEILFESKLDEIENIPKISKEYKLLKNYLDEIEMNGEIEKLWGLVYSQIVSIIKIHDEYNKVGENIKHIANKLNMNHYRVSMLMKFVRKLDYLIKHKNYSTSKLVAMLLDSEIRIKMGRSSYTQEVYSILSV